MKVQLSLEIDSKGNATLTNTGQQLEEVGNKSKFAETALKGVAAVGAAAAAALAIVGAAGVAAVANLLDVGGRFTDLHAQTGVAVQDLQEFAFAGKLAGGVAGEDIAKGMQKLQREMVEGSGKTRAALQAIGLSMDELKEKSAGDQLEAVLKNVSQIADPAQRTAVAVELLGKSGAALIPLGANFDQVRQRAQDLGVIMRDDVIGAADDLGDSIDTLGMTTQGLGNNFAAAVVTSGPLHTLIEGLTDIIGQLSVWVRENEAAIRGWVDGGVILLANALVGAVNVASGAVEAFKWLADAWVYGKRAASDLAAALELMADLKSNPLDAASAWNEYTASLQSNDAQLRAGLAGNEKAFEGVRGAVEKAYGAVDGLRDKVEAADGAIHKSTEDTERNREVNLAAAQAAQKHAAEQEKLAKALTAAGLAAQNSSGSLEAEAAAMLKDQTKLPEPGAGLAPPIAVSQAAMDKAIGDMWLAMHGMLRDKPPLPVPAKIDVAGALTDIGNVASKGFDIANALIGGFNDFMAATNSSSSVERAFNGAQVGANVGAQIGGAIGGPVGEGIGRGAGAIIGALAGIFHEPSWVAVGREAGQVLGMAVSDELAQAIEQTADDLGVSVAAASLLHLNDAIEESGDAASTFAPQVLDLMQGIADGSIPAREGLESLGEAFTSIRDDAMAASASGSAALSAILNGARATGVFTPEMEAHLQEQAKKIADGVNQVFAGMDVSFLGNHQGELFTLAFGAAMKDGLPAAYEQFKDAYGKVSEAGGLGVDAGTGKLFELMGQEDGLFKGAAEAGMGLKSIVEGVSASGLLTAESFQTLGLSAQSAFDQAIAGGAGQKEALAAVMPYLQAAVDASAAQGVQLDENTQALVDQAEAAGYAFNVDPMIQMVDLLAELVRVMGGDIPDSVTRAGEAIGTLPGAVEPAAAAAEKAATDAADAATLAAYAMSQAVGEAAATSADAIVQTAADMAFGIEDSLTSLPSSMAEAAAAAESEVQSLADAASSILSAIEVGPINIPVNYTGGGGPGGTPAHADGSFAVGATNFRVPFDGYMAQLHAGEILNVTPAAEVNRMRNGGSGGTGASGGADAAALRALMRTLAILPDRIARSTRDAVQKGRAARVTA